MMPAHKIAFRFDGQPVVAMEGESIAAALLRHGIVGFRIAVDGESLRGPYCGMGICFDCRVQVSGPNRPRLMVRSCITPVAEGMDVRSVPYPELNNV